MSRLSGAVRRSSSLVQAALPGHKASLGDATAADAQLAAMGYKSELPRSLSMLSVLGLSFAIMAVPYGISTTFYLSVTVLYGWIFVSLISLAIAASLAEICSVYPTAGGVYYWSAMLATEEWAPITSWITGWLTLVVTLSINFGGAQLILSAISLWDTDYVPTDWQTVLMFWAVMLLCATINVVGVRYLDYINKIAIYWTAAAVLIIIVTVLAMADNLRSGEFVFAEFDASASGWPSGWSWFVGLLQPGYTLTGYGMVAAMCEEVQQPQREVPRAIVLSVAAAGITGVIYLIPILFVMPDIAEVLGVASGQPIGFIFAQATGSPGGAFGLLFLILGIWLFAGIGALTAASRCTYAFARDGAIPGSGLWRRITKTPFGEIPLWGLVLSTVVDCLLGLIYFGSSAAFFSFTGVATICLSTSYGLPILVSVLRRRAALEHSPYSLGRYGYAINIATILWIVLAVVIFCMPVSIPVDASTMNYASAVFAGFAAISIAWYFIHGRRAFKGPPIVRAGGDAVGVAGGAGGDAAVLVAAPPGALGAGGEHGHVAGEKGAGLEEKAVL